MTKTVTARVRVHKLDEFSGMCLDYPSENNLEFIMTGLPSPFAHSGDQDHPGGHE